MSVSRAWSGRSLAVAVSCEGKEMRVLQEGNGRKRRSVGIRKQKNKNHAGIAVAYGICAFVVCEVESG